MNPLMCIQMLEGHKAAERFHLKNKKMSNDKALDWWADLGTMDAMNLIEKYFPKRNILNISLPGIYFIYVNESKNFNHKK